MAVPERVPLPTPDDRLERVVLQEQDAALGDAGAATRDGTRLIARMHHAEAVDDDIGRVVADHAGTRPRRLRSSSHEPPCGLAYSATVAPAGK